MLWQVPKQINRLARNVVMNHPNSFNAEIWRKKYLRDDPLDDGGRPTIGGMGILSTEDETEYEWQYMGNCYALPADQFQPAVMVDRGDANIGAEDEFRFMIEVEKQASEDGFFMIKNHDVLYIILGEPPYMCKLAYEVVTQETTSNIPPFSVRYVCVRRDHLDMSVSDLKRQNGLE